MAHSLWLVLLLLLLLPVAALAEPQMLPRDWGEPVPLRDAVVVAPSEGAAKRLAGLLTEAGLPAEVTADLLV